MSDQAKFDKMLRLLMKLSDGVQRSIPVLADQMDMSTRTVYRYLDTFRDAGFKVEKSFEGNYSIDKKASEFRGIDELIHFSEEEALILSRAIDFVYDERKFNSDLYNKLFYLFDKDAIANQLISREQSDNAMLLKDAIKRTRVVVLKDYSSSNSASCKDRLIEPFDFTTIYDAVWAYDIEDGKSKMFKIKRIKEVIVRDDEHKHTDSHQKRELDIFRFGGEKKKKVSFAMSQIAYNLLLEEYPLSGDCITRIEENRYRFKGWVYNYKGLMRFMLGFMDEIDAVSPKELRLCLQEKMDGKQW